MDFAEVNSEYMFEYISVLLFIIVALGIILISVLASYLIVPQKPYASKLSAYECGFDAFEDTKKQFDIRFYLVAVLFIIFDIEVVFIYPWAVSFYKLDIVGFSSMILFIVILTIGFIYEWKKGALQWN